MNICVIPARGGSKRIPKKNIRNFHGQPIIAYSIQSAINSGCFEKVIVSTDDPEIAAVALEFGADVPFERPAEISDDHATTVDVIQHVIGWCESQGWQIDNLCCVYATAPFLTSEDLIQGLNLLEDQDINYVFSAASFSFPIQRGFYLDEVGEVVMFQPQHINTRSQDLREAYHDAGQFYWGKLPAFKVGLPFFGKHSKPVFISRERVQDIDTLEDWEYAEKLFQIVTHE